MENLINLFFNLSINNGWNGIALMTYGLIIGLIVTFIIESK